MRKNGYTLIELLAVLAITGFVFTLGYGGFRLYAQRQQTTAIARQIHADLRLAKEQALAGKKPNGCSTTLEGYKFVVDSTNNLYRVSASCMGGDIEVKSESIPKGFTLTAPSTNPILFKPIGIGTNIPEGTSVTIKVTNPSISYSQSVIVGSSGDVEQ